MIIVSNSEYSGDASTDEDQEDDEWDSGHIQDAKNHRMIGGKKRRERVRERWE